MRINLNSTSAQGLPQQVFSFFTTESWSLKKGEFPQEVSRFFSGKKGEVFPLISESQTRYFIGLGKEVSTATSQQVAEVFSQKNKKGLLSVPTLIETETMDVTTLQALVTGLFLGTYQYPFRPEHPFWQSGFELTFKQQRQELLQLWETQIFALCKGQFTAMDWLNKPQNFKRADAMNDFLKQISKEHGLKHRVFRRKEAEAQGLGAFLAVNRASEEEGAFTIIEYDCGIKNAKTVGLVGKCVLFDTGGISLKPGNNMHYMKSDLGGAVAVIGTLIAAALMKLKTNIIAILPVTDNAISEKAYVPSDVVKAYNGKTIEVLNTDAEGRLTLADGLSYLAKNYTTDYLIDLATLTGSAVRTFGDTCGALFSNQPALKDALIQAGDQTGQRLWHMPLWDVWEEDIKAEVADLRNISLKPVGDCIVAAKFLENFIEGHPAWAHLDIAGVAFGNVSYAKEKSATGYGVGLLTNFLANLQA